jgi:hypothetical protein
LRNLLQRQGYESIEAVRADGRAQGVSEGELIGKRAAILHSAAPTREWCARYAPRMRIARVRLAESVQIANVIIA